MVDVKASSNLEDDPGHPLGVLAVHRLDDALHDGVTVRGRRGTRFYTWDEQLALSMLGDAGFTAVQVAGIDVDPFNNYYVARK